jgi:hypothetical protein
MDKAYRRQHETPLPLSPLPCPRSSALRHLGLMAERNSPVFFPCLFPALLLCPSAEGADWEILLFVATMSNSAKAAQACHQAEMDELRTLCDMVASPQQRLHAFVAPSLVHCHFASGQTVKGMPPCSSLRTDNVCTARMAGSMRGPHRTCGITGGPFAQTERSETPSTTDALAQILKSCPLVRRCRSSSRTCAKHLKGLPS